MKLIKVFSKTCGPCKVLDKNLKESGIEYDSVDIESDEGDNLIEKYNIPKDHIIRHYDVSGKACPGIIGWNLAHGSNSEKKYKDFVDSLYEDRIPSEVAEPDYFYANVDTSKSNEQGNDQDNLPRFSNSVLQLASVNRMNSKNVLKQSDSRKAKFEALRNELAEEAPEMGREILLTAELYDSNILKGTQESREERN